MIKPLSLIALILCIIGIALFFYEQDADKGLENLSGQALLKELDTKSLNKIRVQSSEGLLELHQSLEGWKEIGLDYPLSAEKIQEFLLELTDLRLGDLITKNPERHALFQLLAPPDDKQEWDEDKHAITVSLMRGDDSKLLEIHLGKDREQGSGQYLRYAGADEVYLLPESLEIDTDPNEWLSKSLLKINDEMIHKISFQNSSDPKFTLNYDNESKRWSVLEDPEAELKDDAISDITKRLKDLSFTKILSGELSDNSTGRTQLTGLDVALADGNIYSLQVGENENADGNHVLNLRMSIQIESDSPDLRKEMERFNQKTGGRLFEIRSWEAKDLLKKQADLLKED
jgi:hypothetical protein